MNLELKQLLSPPSSDRTKTTIITGTNESSQEFSPSKFILISKILGNNEQAFFDEFYNLFNI